jgi:hypothetical protein
VTNAAPRRQPKRKPNPDPFDVWVKRARDAGLLALGFAGTINELFIQPEPRYLTYPILGALLGSPIAFRADERRRAAEAEADDGGADDGAE